MDPIELAWAAGFFDGEGCAGITASEFRVQLKQNATGSDGVPDTLQRFAFAVGTGRIGGPYRDRPTRRGFSDRRRAYFIWYARRSEAQAVCDLLWSNLGAAKRRSIEEALDNQKRLAHQ